MKKSYFLGVFLFVLSFSVSGQPPPHPTTNKYLAVPRSQDSYLGYSVGVSGNVVIAGSHGDNTDEVGQNFLSMAGAAHIFELIGFWPWTPQKITNSDRVAGDYFGRRVSISGSYAFVSAHEQDYDSVGSNYIQGAGAVYIFAKNSHNNWAETQKITDTYRFTDDRFGYWVHVNGNQAVISSPFEDRDESDSNYMFNAGAAFIYELQSNGKWEQSQKIVASDRSGLDNFGISAFIENNKLIVGAYQEDDNVIGTNPLSNAGSAYLFEKNSQGEWIEMEKIVSHDRSIDDRFGGTVALNGDYAFVSAWDEDHDVNGINSQSNAGSVYCYKLNKGKNWIQHQKIVPSDRSAEDKFGISLSSESTHLFIGAHTEDENSIGMNSKADAGSAYSFVLNPITGKWDEFEKITASDRQTDDNFGNSIAYNNYSLVVGAPHQDHDRTLMNLISDAGAYYTFKSCYKEYRIYEWACKSFTLPSGEIVDTTGTYYTTFISSNRCDSILKLFLFVQQPNPNLSQNGLIIKSQQDWGSYKWIDCNTGIVIPGETKQSFTAKSNGRYAAIVTLNNCTDTSDCVTVTSVRINQISNSVVKVSPNPNNGFFTIQFLPISPNIQIHILNLQGQSIWQKEIENEDRVEVELDTDPGLYFLQVKNEGRVVTKKIVIQ